MAVSLIQRGPMRSRRLHLRDFNLRSGAANLQRPPNKRLEKDLRPARSARWPRPLSPIRSPKENSGHVQIDMAQPTDEAPERFKARLDEDVKTIRFLRSGAKTAN